MTVSLAAAASRAGVSNKAVGVAIVACSFCRRRLADEFFFTCRRCDASYCYIHTSRHHPSACARQSRKNQREATIGNGPWPVETRHDDDVPLARVGPSAPTGSSANV
jgi:hypothetical protein